MLTIKENRHLDAEEVIKKSIELYPKWVEIRKAKIDPKDLNKIYYRLYPPERIGWILVNNPDNYEFYFDCTDIPENMMPFEYDLGSLVYDFTSYYLGIEYHAWNSVEEDGEIICFDSCKISRFTKKDGYEAISKRTKYPVSF